MNKLKKFIVKPKINNDKLKLKTLSIINGENLEEPDEKVVFKFTNPKKHII